MTQNLRINYFVFFVSIAYHRVRTDTAALLLWGENALLQNDVAIECTFPVGAGGMVQ